MNKRIFILIDWFSPAFKAGGPIQSVANLVSQYQEPGVSFRIFTSNHDHDGTILNQVPHDTWYRINAHTEVWYASVSTARFSQVEKEVRAWSPSLIFINGLFSPVFNFLPAWKLRDFRVIVAVRGMLHPGALSQKAFKKKLFLLFWKLLGLPRRLEYQAAAEEEVAFIQQAFGQHTRIHLAPNFPRILPFSPTERQPGAVLKLASVALISPMKNHLLVLQQLQLVKSAVVWNVYGPVKDAVYFEACQRELSQLPSNIRVFFHGDVQPDQVPVVLKEADVFILPSKSENFGHAIFEALTAGKPVVTSLGTPWSQLESQHAGFNVDVDKNPAGIADAILELAKLDGEAWNHWTVAARSYALSKIDVKTIEAAYTKMFQLHP